MRASCRRVSLVTPRVPFVVDAAFTLPLPLPLLRRRREGGRIAQREGAAGDYLSLDMNGPTTAATAGSILFALQLYSTRWHTAIAAVHEKGWLIFALCLLCCLAIMNILTTL